MKTLRRETGKEKLPTKQGSLTFPGRVVFLCKFLSLTISNSIPHTEVFLLSRSPGKCVKQNGLTRQVARGKHESFFLATWRPCPQATVSETDEAVVKRKRRRVHLVTSVVCVLTGVTLKVITETSNLEFQPRIYIMYIHTNRIVKISPGRFWLKDLVFYRYIIISDDSRSIERPYHQLRWHVYR